MNTHAQIRSDEGLYIQHMQCFIPDAVTGLNWVLSPSHISFSHYYSSYDLHKEFSSQTQISIFFWMHP